MTSSLYAAALLAVGISVTAGAQRASAVARATATQPVEIELRSAARVLVPGDTATVAIRLRPNAGWHAYWRHAGDVGSAPAVEWQLPAGFIASPLRWPTPELIVSPPLASYGYAREVHFARVHSGPTHRARRVDRDAQGQRHVGRVQGGVHRR